MIQTEQTRKQNTTVTGAMEKPATEKRSEELWGRVSVFCFGQFFVTPSNSVINMNH